MASFENLEGRRFGKFVVIAFHKPKPTYWLCRCDCGNERSVAAWTLKSGASKSCGCHKREKLIISNRTHGRTHSREYSSWRGMKERCNNPKNIGFSNYGGRGIKVCKRWLNSFVNFVLDMGKCPPGFSLDRINNDGNYCPSNCRWADRTTQHCNQRRARMITHNGKTQNLKLWSKEVGVSQSVIAYRLKRQYPIAEALSGESFRN